jgi:DeoR family transcriptional regulator, fructose operon transcriptional repressor
MLPTQRRLAILAEIRDRAAVSAEELSREYAVSVETIRRDLRGLQEKGLLERVYGGAIRPPGRSSEGSFAARSTRYIERKRAIAAMAASLVEPEDTIVIDVGTTALEVARALPATFRGRVLTSSVPAAMELSGRRGDLELLLCGGQVRRGDGACAGAHAEAFFAEFYADRAFLGSGGIHPGAGLTDYYPAEVIVRRTIINHTETNYVLADSSKLGVIAVHRVCPLDRLTAVLTDDEENDDAHAALAATGLTLLRARAAGPDHDQGRLTGGQAARSPGGPATHSPPPASLANRSPRRAA